MTDDAADGQKMPLLDHLIELRQRLLYSVVGLLVAFLVCFYFAQTLFDFLAEPLARILIDRAGDEGGNADPRFIFTGLPDVFFTHIKVAFFFGAFITCPIFLTQLWKFVAPGLYRHEKHAFGPFLVATPILFFTGGALVYYVIFPLAWEFFLAFEQAGTSEALPIQLEAKVNEYLSLVMKLIFAFGLCFQLPVIMTLLAKVGIATSEGMASKRKYAIVGVFIVAAIFTPPDPLSQISLAVPIILLYEISIYMAKLVERKKQKDELEDEEGSASGDLPTA